MTSNNNVNKVRPMRKETLECISALKDMGFKFNIITPVDHRVELHYEYERFDGRKGVHFVAELDGYGNITDWGPYTGDEMMFDMNKILNADGEILVVDSKGNWVLSTQAH